MRALGPGLLACLCLAPGLAAAQEGELSSRRDHMLAINRDLAVACKPGDLERVPGRSLGEVFGDKGQHARSAFGVAQIPLGACVEIELVAEVA